MQNIGGYRLIRAFTKKLIQKQTFITTLLCLVAFDSYLINEYDAHDDDDDDDNLNFT